MAVGDDDVIDEAVVKIRPDLDGFGKQLQARVDTQAAKIKASIKLVADRSGFGASIKEKVAEQQALSNNATVKVGLRARRDRAFTDSIREAVAKQNALSNPTIKVGLEVDKAGLGKSVKDAVRGAGGGGGRGGNGGGAGPGDGEDDGGNRSASYLLGLRLNNIRRNRLRVRTLEEQLSRDEEAAQLSEQARQRRRYRNHLEQMDHLHGAADGQDRQRFRSFSERVERDELAAYREAAERERRSVTERANIRERGRRRERKSLFDTLGGNSRIIDFGGRGVRPTNLLVGALVALSPLLVSVASSAVEASFAFAALGTAGIGAAAAITGLVVGFQGVTEALKLRQTVNKQALAADAKDNTGALLDAADRLIDAQEALRRSQREELQAQLDINDARKRAVRDLEDLRQAVRDLQNQERSDRLSVAESKDRAAEVGRNFFATGLEKARANQDYSDAKVRLDDTKLERRQKKTDLADSVAKGIEGSDTVKDAKQRAREATEARKRDQRQLANAKRDAKEAASGTSAATSSASELEQKIKDMSPAAREMYYWFDANEEKLKDLRRTVEQGVLPGFTEFLRQVTKAGGKGGKSSLQIFAEAAGRLGGKIGDLAGDLGEMTRSKAFRKDFATIIDANADAMDDFSQATKNLVKPFMRIFSDASPLLTRFSDYVLDLSERFAAFIEQANKSGDLKRFFKDAGDELARWWGLAKSIGNFLKEVFFAAEPSGGTIIDRLTKFFDDSAKWVRENREKVKGFFDRLANLPYGEILRSVTQMTAMFLAMHLVKWSLVNPVFAALSAFAAANPQAASEFLQTLTDLVSGPVKFLVDHPDAFGGLIALIAAFKGRKVLSLALNLPVISSLKDLLTKRFNGLDKILGGSTSTGTMTVHAGVVNIVGAGVTPGRPGTPGAPGAPGGKGVKAAAGGLAASIGLAVGAYFASQINTDNASRFEKGMVSGLQGALTGASIGATFGPVGIAAGTLIGTAVGLAIAAATAPPKTVLQEESATFSNLRTDADFIEKTRNGPNGNNQKIDIIRDPNLIKSRRTVTEYIKARQAAQKADYDYQVKLIGKPLADRRLIEENEKSISVLSKFLQQLGLGKAAADNFARSQFQLGGEYDKMTPKIKTTSDAILTANESLYRANERSRNLRDTLDKLGIKSDGLKVQVDNLALSLDNVNGTRTITLTVNGEEKVFKSLSEALTYQYALNTGSSLSEARNWIDSQNRQRQRSNDKNDIGAATGGYILGRGTATSDSIPARLSRGEFVQREKAVRYYGPNAMHALNKMQIPRENLFASGGMADTSKIPMRVDMSKTLIPSVMSPNMPAFTGDANLAETAERVARAMGATQKQLIALIEAGLVESGMRNINYGDRDSVGFLQQRPSQGWGTVKQLMNPEYATRKFIEAARRVKAQDKMTAGELAQAVQRSAFPLRYGQREGEAIGLLNARAPFLPGYTGPVGAPGNGSKATLIAFGRWLQSQGYTVSENPVFGSVGRHSNGSLHYTGNAIDVNRGAGTSKQEQRYLAQVLADAHAAGLRTIFMTAGHYNHLHVDTSQSPSFGQIGGDTNGVQFRAYDSGGPLPPGYTLAYNGTGRTETVRTHQQEKALHTGGTVRLDKRDLIELARVIAAATPAVNMDGRKVAELTNRYTYLPAGV